MTDYLADTLTSHRYWITVAIFVAIAAWLAVASYLEHRRQRPHIEAAQNAEEARLLLLRGVLADFDQELIDEAHRRDGLDRGWQPRGELLSFAELRARHNRHMNAMREGRRA